MNPQHGEVWLADLGLAGKTRPVVILSSNTVDAPRTLVIHVPITSQSRGSVLEVPVGDLTFLSGDSVVNVQAIGALPRVRFERRLGSVTTGHLNRIKQALALACDLRLVTQ